MGESNVLPESVSIHSVKLSPVELNKLLDELEDSATIPATNKRRHNRVGCRCTGVLIAVNQSGFESTFYIPVRDVSRSGIAFLHRSMLHKGTECTIRIRGASREWIQVGGTIMRSRYLRSMVYEIGLRFDEELDEAALQAISSKPGLSAGHPTATAALQGSLNSLETTDVRSHPARS